MRRVWCAFLSIALTSAWRIHAQGNVGQRAPQLVVDKWIAPQPNTSGKVVLLEFWATWCPACRQSVAHLNDLQRKFPDKVVVIGLSDENEEVLRAWANPKPLYPLATDPQARTQRQLGIDSIPHLLVIDPEGMTRWRGDPRHLREAQLEALLTGRTSTNPAPALAAPPSSASKSPAPASSPPQTEALAATPKPPDPRLFSPAAKARVAVQLKDGTWVQGEWIGRFANRIAVRLTNGRLMDIKDAEIVKCQELRN